MLLSVLTVDQSSLQMAMQNFLIVHANVVDFIHFVRHCVHIQILSNVNEVKNVTTWFRKVYFTVSGYELTRFFLALRISFVFLKMLLNSKMTRNICVHGVGSG
jgi:hypothetical protein